MQPFAMDGKEKVATGAVSHFSGGKDAGAFHGPMNATEGKHL